MHHLKRTVRNLNTLQKLLQIRSLIGNRRQTSNATRDAVTDTQAPRFRFHVFRFTLLVTFFVLTLWASTTPADAQSPPDAEVEFFVQAPEPGQPVTVGDQITLRLEIVHPADSRVVLPQVEEQWESFVVVDQTPPQTIDQGNGTAVTGKDIIVALFRPGEYETPTIVVTHRKPDGSIEELAAPIIPIRITSVLTEESTLQELKPQVDLPEPLLWPWLLVGTLLALLAFGVLTAVAMRFYRRWQKRPEAEFVPVPFEDARPPEVIAHAELDRIEALDLPARQQIKVHYSLVATCLRRYIEGRYHIPALEQTTTELRDAFHKAEIPVRDVSGLMGIISESDWVKFARYVPQHEEVTGLVHNARTVIDATTPVPEPPEPPLAPPEKEEMAV